MSFVLFRMVQRTPGEDAFVLRAADFLSHWELEPHNKQYQSCKAFAVSLFASLEGARLAHEKALQARRNLGNYVAELQLAEGAGLCYLTNPETGHYSLWQAENYLNYLTLLGVYLMEEDAVV